jgi:hypothetical protein
MLTFVRSNVKVAADADLVAVWVETYQVHDKPLPPLFEK